MFPAFRFKAVTPTLTSVSNQPACPEDSELVSLQLQKPIFKNRSRLPFPSAAAFSLQSPSPYVSLLGSVSLKNQYRFQYFLTLCDMLKDQTKKENVGRHLG